MNRLAEHALSVAHGSNTPITNLQLQKVLFFTTGMSIRQNENELNFFNEIYHNDFEKWRYGPVVPSLYFRFNIFGNKSIDDEGNYVLDFNRFDELINQLLNIDVYRLVALSHQMESWSNYEREILSGERIRPYTLDEIARDFKNA